MGALRWEEKAESDFSRASKMQNVQAALLLLGEWLGKPIMEEEIRQYDIKTGDYQKMGIFKPYRAWNGVLWLESLGNAPSLAKNDPLYTAILNTIKVGEAVSVGDLVVVEHIPERSEGGLGSMSDQGGTFPAHLRFLKPRRL